MILCSGLRHGVHFTTLHGSCTIKKNYSRRNLGHILHISVIVFVFLPSFCNIKPSFEITAHTAAVVIKNNYALQFTAVLHIFQTSFEAQELIIFHVKHRSEKSNP